MDSYLQFAALHLQQGERSGAETILAIALSIRPGNAAAAELREKVRQH